MKVPGEKEEPPITSGKFTAHGHVLEGRESRGFADRTSVT